MATGVQSKVVVSVVSIDMPLENCPIGKKVLIKKDYWNEVDDKALSVLVKHKRTGKWTFIGYVAANRNYIPVEGVTNEELYNLLDPENPICMGTVVDKRTIIFPYGKITTALIVEVDFDKQRKK